VPESTNDKLSDVDFSFPIDKGSGRDFQGFAESLSVFENQDFLNHFETEDLACPDFGEPEDLEAIQI
jgi:hypothetical protein